MKVTPSSFSSVTELMLGILMGEAHGNLGTKSEKHLFWLMNFAAKSSATWPWPTAWSILSGKAGRRFPVLREPTSRQKLFVLPAAATPYHLLSSAARLAALQAHLKTALTRLKVSATAPASSLPQLIQSAR